MIFSLSPSPIWAKFRKWWKLAAENGNAARKKNSPSALRNMLLCAKDIPFPCSEAYRSIRTNLMFALAPQAHKIVAVTSPNAADGKSLTAANIAMALAMMNKKVLFIDADLKTSSASAVKSGKQKLVCLKFWGI